MDHIRLNTARTIGIRGFKSMFYSCGLYIVSLISCILAVIVAGTYIDSIRENGLLIISNPLNPPFNLAINISGAFLALMASMSVSREYDSGTLEVLFYGPVDTESYIIGKYVEHILTFAVMLFIYLVVFFCFGIMTNFGFSSRMVLYSILSLGLASSVTSFGIFISSFTKKIRTSILLLIILLVLFLGIQWAESLASGLNPESLSPVVVYFISILDFVSGVIRYISPFAYFNQGLEAVTVGNLISYSGNLIASLIYSIILLILAIMSFRKKGVRVR
jgi:ABC-type transport system involved in multi-copper enzyme maturation permease subunit